MPTSAGVNDRGDDDSTATTPPEVHPNFEPVRRPQPPPSQPQSRRRSWLPRWLRRRRRRSADADTTTAASERVVVQDAAGPQKKDKGKHKPRRRRRRSAATASAVVARPATLPRGQSNAVSALIDQLDSGPQGGMGQQQRRRGGQGAAEPVERRASRPVCVRSVGYAPPLPTYHGGSQHRAAEPPATATYGVALGAGDAPRSTGLEGSFVVRLERHALHILSPMRFRTLFTIGYHEMLRSERGWERMDRACRGCRARRRDRAEPTPRTALWRSPRRLCSSCFRRHLCPPLGTASLQTTSGSTSAP